MSDHVVRSLRRGWRNVTVGGAWTRRVRWYEWRGAEGTSIRLNFNERPFQGAPRKEWVDVNSYYDNDADALEAMERFIAGDPARDFRD